MSTNLNHYALFSALTLFTLGGLQLPVMATSNGTISSSKQEVTSAPFHTQGSMRLAQAGSNCRMIKNGGGALYTSSSGTDSVPLNRGTLVEVNLKNVSNGRVQVEVPSQNYTSGFVKASDLTSCGTTAPKFTGCYRVRNVVGIGPDGLVLRMYPYMGSTEAKLHFPVGTVFKVRNRPEDLVRDGRRWVEIVPIKGLPGYVNDGPVGDPERNLEPASCTGV